MAFDSILICVPSTSNSMKSATAITLADITKALVMSGRIVDIHNIDSAEIVTARDMFANMLLHSERWDSLLFLDSDMAFDANLILRMIAFGEPVMGAAYVRRQLDLEQFGKLRQRTGDTAKALAQAASFTLRPHWPEGPAPLEIRDGFASMAAVGMGCTLISRNVLVAMVEANVVAPRLDLHFASGKTCFSFFEPIIHDDGVRLGEDYSFCRRWSYTMGNKVWVCIDEPLSHIGGFDYRARYVDLLAPAKPAASGNGKTKKMPKGRRR